jgi:hypothetical protein
MTKEKILDKALELFVIKGYFGCSMDDIAKAVEIKTLALFPLSQQGEHISGCFSKNPEQLYGVSG